LKTAVWRCVRYSLGSLLLGSLLIAIVKFIRYVMMYIDHKTKDLQKNDILVKILMKCVHCCLWCLEKCIKFIAGTAYILVAIKGESFCAAAKEVFHLLFSHTAVIGVTQMISEFVIFLSEMTIILSSGFLYFLYINSQDKYEIAGSSPLSEPAITVMVTLLVATFVATLIMGVFKVAIETVLVCFCIDKDENGQNPNGYFMNPSLVSALGKSAKKKVMEKEPKEHGV